MMFQKNGLFSNPDKKANENKNAKKDENKFINQQQDAFDFDDDDFDDDMDYGSDASFMGKDSEEYNKYLKSMGIDPNAPKPVVQEEYPLLRAVRNNDILEVTRLLNEGADIHYADEKGITALWEASYKGFLPIVKLLVRRGAKDVPTKTYGDAKYISRLFKHDKVHEFLCSLENGNNEGGNKEGGNEHI